MPTWTQPEDVINAWIGDNKPEDVDLVEIWVGKAEREIRRQVTDIQARIDAAAEMVPPSTSLLDDVRDVATDMVHRVFRNPEGMRQFQTTTGPYSEGGTFGGDNPGTITMTAAEIAKLTGTIESTGSKAFTVDTMPRDATVLYTPEELLWLGAPAKL